MLFQYLWDVLRIHNYNINSDSIFRCQILLKQDGKATFKNIWEQRDEDSDVRAGRSRENQYPFYSGPSHIGTNRGCPQIRGSLIVSYKIHLLK